MNAIAKHLPLLATGLLVVAACGDELDLELDPGSEATATPSTGTTESGIRSGTPVPSNTSLWRYVVGLHNGNKGYCSGTIIGSQWVVTAAHCKPKVFDRVQFFEGSEPAELISIDRVYYPDSVNPYVDDLHNGSKFSDIAVVHLMEPVPAGYWAASLPSYPTDPETTKDRYGYVVGSGFHDEDTSIPYSLRYRSGRILSGSATDGGFHISINGTNDGDSGGPFLTWHDGQYKLLGVLYGSTSRWGRRRSWFTTVRDYVPFINSVLDGSRSNNHYVTRKSGTCNQGVTLTRSWWPGSYYLSRWTGRKILFDVRSPHLQTTCGSSVGTLSCPDLTNNVRLYRDYAGSTKYYLDCYRRN